MRLSVLKGKRMYIFDSFYCTVIILIVKPSSPWIRGNLPILIISGLSLIALYYSCACSIIYTYWLITVLKLLQEYPNKTFQFECIERCWDNKFHVVKLNPQKQYIRSITNQFWVRTDSNTWHKAINKTLSPPPSASPFCNRQNIGCSELGGRRWWLRWARAW